MKVLLGSFFLFFFFLSCETEKKSSGADKLFTRIDAAISGIHFQNELIETEEANYYKYMYSYIGGGVAAADFNQDGLEDLFFVSNTFDNKLYLNQGDLKFNDVSQEAGLLKRAGFDVGVSVADVNNDGWLDIYITRGGWKMDNNAFANMLYINNGLQADGANVTFTERAAEYGLADNNRSVQASFFDYDKDGDLDVYVSNTPDFEDRAAAITDLVAARTDPTTITLKGSDKLYNNDGTGHFTDVTQQAGIFPDIGFGLNPQVGDLNNDGWLDIYVCNDFRIPDFAYVNNGDGTFREGRNELFKHMSFNSMGGDIGDVNNDGLPDLYTLDMNPDDYVRSKTTMGMTPQGRFEEMVRKDYHHQYMHNMLQVNNGNGSFREVANSAGVANTDWSWSTLLADFDLDGYNDIFVTNGVFRDVIDRDANNRILQDLRNNPRKPSDEDFLNFTRMLPQQKLTNFFFRNRGDLTFEDVSYVWADSIPNYSNGATYTDLDNDGDLDVVVNNINDPATVLRNNTIGTNRTNYLKVKLKGPEKNRMGVGTVVNLHLEDNEIQTRQLITSRGFLSSVSNTLHFGLGDNSSARVEVIWSDGKTQFLKEVPTNQLLVVNYSDGEEPARVPAVPPALFVRQETNYRHIDPSYNDYQNQILLPHKLSQTGPAAAKADVNGDGLEDVFIGGGHTQLGQLLIARKSGGFQVKTTTDFEKDKRREDVAACFFDADNDGDKDLYIASGSYEFNPNSKMLIDRLYLNDGKGNLTKVSGRIPEIAAAGSVVRAADFDDDGDQDLFVGSRVIPGLYPFSPVSYLLVNNDGKFSVANADIAPELDKAGMVTDAAWNDLDGDGDLDLVVTGEWMGVEVFENDNGRLSKSSAYPTLSSTVGWWNKILIVDVDQDGDGDIVAGNLGLNSKFHATPEKPLHVYTKDFDFNGTADVFLAKYYKGAEVPVRGKTCTAQQLPHLAQKIPTYSEFASLDLEGVVGPGIKSALHYGATEFRSGIFINESGSFRFVPLPNSAQQSPTNSILYEDFDQDGQADLLIAGNNYLPEIETTRYDAGIGQFLKGGDAGQFVPIPYRTSGFFANKDVRNMLKVGNLIVVINNNDKHDVFEWNKGKNL
jgi:hypothetical protein